MFRGRGSARGMEDVGVQAVNDESALLLVEHDAGVAEDAQVVRDVDDLGPESAGDFADVAGAVAQAVDDPQPFRVGQRRSIRAQRSGSNASVMPGASRSREDGTGIPSPLQNTRRPPPDQQHFVPHRRPQPSNILVFPLDLSVILS